MNGTRTWLLGLLMFAVLASPSSVTADARSDYLARLLRSSTQFRVRVQAALSLGRASGDQVAVAALAGALDDGHPAVRAAAASGLERLGDAAALRPLRSHRNDSHAEVRSAVESAIVTLERDAEPTRPGPETPIPAVVAPGAADTTYYVGVGMPGSRVESVNEPALSAAHAFLRSHVSRVAGVELAPPDETPKQAENVIRRRRLTGYYIDGSIVSVESRPDGAVRASVSVIVATYPGRDMRSILQGAATVMGGGAGARDQAIEAAFTGALRNLTSAMAAGRR